MEYLLKSISPEAVRYHFDGLFPPANLLVVLHNKKAALKNLKRQRILNASQWAVLFPTGSTSVTSCNFDLTLMICLLRNISGIAAPVRGFDVLPSSSDISPGADLARIKHYRNLSAHSGDGKLSNQMFNDAWKDVSEASIRLGGNVIQQKCANLKICSLDSSFFKQLLLDLKCQKENLTRLTELVEILMLKVETFEQTHQHVLQDPVPNNIRERITKVISDWKSSDEKFVQTNSSKHLLEVLKKNKIIVVTGNAGVGKSVTSRHVGLHMLLEGFDVLPVKSPKDISTYAAKTRKALFIVDDICGRYNVIQSEIEKWDRYASDIKDCFSISPIKILATCRLQVFKHPILQRLELLTQCQFNMTSEKYSPTVQEKRSIADVYIPEEYTKKMSEEYIQKYDCFPLLCCMVSKFQESNIIDFIGNPYNYFEGEFDKMSITAGMNYCALLSVTVFNGKLSETLLDDELSTKDKAAFVDIFEASMQNTNTSRTLLSNHLDILLGVYITKLDDIYSFIHGKIFDFACQYFSKKCMKCFIEHGDILLLCERFEFDFLTHADDIQRIAVPESFEKKYFYRMLNEVTEGTFLDIFGCKQMKNEIFRKRFLHTLELQNDELIAQILNISHLGINFLHLMCEQGDKEMVEFCISKGMDINGCDDIGMSPLHIACKYGYEHVVNVLIQSGVNVNSHKRRGLTPLYEACFTDQTQIVEKLLKSGARPNVYNKRGLIPLTVSAKNGNIKITQLLLQYKADVNKENNDGISALHEACINEKEDIVNILIGYDAHIDCKTNNNETPLYFASKKHNCRIIEILISKGACMFETSKLTKLSPLCLIKEKDDVQLLRTLLHSLKNKNTSFSFVFAELEKACFSNDSKFLRIILEMNINVDAQLSSGDTALTIACSEGFKTIAEMLLNTKANIYGLCHNNRNPLQLACLNHHPEIVNMLISKNVDCNYISCRSTLPFPLHISCMMNDYESIEALIQSDADVNQISEIQGPVLCDFKCKEDADNFFIDEWNDDKTYMMTPLEIICMGKSLNLRIVNHLLENKARTNIKSANGINPLLVACFYEYNDLISILLKNEANINACNEIDTLCLAYMQYNGEEDIIDLLSYTDFATEVSKSTSLHIASMNNSHNMVNQLLQNHARLNISCNISPFLLAIQNGNYQMSGGTRKMILHYYKKLGVVKDVHPIHAACLSGYTDVVETLVQNNRFHYAETAIGISSAQVACIKGYIYSDNHNMIKQYFFLSPLQISCLGQYWDIFKILMHKKVNFTETFDVSTNLIACFSGNNKAIEASLDDTQIYKISVLWLLVIHKQNDIAKYILDTIRNSDLEVSKSLKTLFLRACSNGNLEIASLIYSKLVNLNIIEIDNVDTLYSSCENCHRDVAEFLVSNCICTESATPDNEVPLQTAYRTCLDYIVELLLRDGADPFLIKAEMDAFRKTSKSIQAECLRELFAFWNANVYSVNTCPDNFLDRVSDRGEKMLYSAYLKKNADLMNLIVCFGANINFTYGEKNDTLLMKACKDNDIQLTKLLLENSPNLDIRNNEGETALCISCELDRFDIAELFVNCGANVNICNNEGLSPLYFACIQIKLNTVRLLLRNQADANVCLSRFKSLLIICCESRAYEIVDLLLQYGADANFCYYWGDTALNKSLQMADAKLTKSLLAYTADWKDMCLDLQYSFIKACKKGCVDFVQMILQRDQSFDVNAAFDGKTPLYACYEALSHVDSSQYTSQIKTGSLLLQHGADLFVSTNGNDTAFHQLCAKGNLSDIKEVLENCLINQTILGVEFAHACANNRNELACLFNKIVRRQLSTDNLHNIFFLAAKYGMDDIIEDVLHSNIDLNSENVKGQTALHIACSKGNDSVVEKLLACGKTDINKQSDNGYTALHFACCNGHRNVIEILLNNGAAINIRSYLGETIVAVASTLHAKVIDILLNWNIEEIIEQLLEHKSTLLKAYSSSCSNKSILRRYLISVDLNSYVDNNEFPLHIACRLSDNELIDQLIDNPNVDVDCISKFGVTPLLICICNQDLRNTKTIIESGASVNKMTNISKQGLQQLFGHTTASFVKDLTPLSFACFVQNCEIIQILIDQNANICSPVHISHGNPDDSSECEILTPLCVSVILNN
ncbi:uncharacterized protein LOC127717166 [Mytilus californianus]|uniref:uncharacterized protein LOC127717166 n=1 Tax=Mytilus californianus TaxID=6549 RepID=UPI00224621E8|nr:uncharacterized protein LOC127717166 [Mytilus californianus]